MARAKPFDIPKREVWEAYKRVRANQGAAGVDEQSIADFEADLTNNLYKLWNWLSSGSYHPPPVRRVDIPKGEGGQTRPLGIPTVADRIAQTVVKRYLEPLVEPCFHPDFVWLPARQVGARCGRRGAAAMLALCVGAGFGYPELLRSHRFRAADASGPQAYGWPVGASLHRTMAESARADDGWKSHRAGKRRAAGRGH